MNYIIEVFDDTNLGENLMIKIIFLVTELQQVGNGILKRANPDLKRTTIFYEGTDIKRDQIFCRAYGFIRRAEEREVVFRLINDSIEERRSGWMNSWIIGSMDCWDWGFSARR